MKRARRGRGGEGKALVLGLRGHQLIGLGVGVRRWARILVGGTVVLSSLLFLVVARVRPARDAGAVSGVRDRWRGALMAE